MSVWLYFGGGVLAGAVVMRIYDNFVFWRFWGGGR